MAMFNPDLIVRELALGAASRCFVIDDALADPEAVARYACEQRAEFAPEESGAYPGLTLPAPGHMADPILEFFATYLRPRFDARRLIIGMCRYSLATLPVDRLRPAQSICHRDSSALAANQSISAAVLYLFRDPGFGGTSFFEPLAPQADIDKLFADAKLMSSTQFERRYGIPQGYLASSNRYFSCVGSVAARWNRLVFYDGALLHSGDIPEPSRLTADPAAGRLTLNFFFTSRRNLA
jgi:hypothetical protein